MNNSGGAWVLQYVTYDELKNDNEKVLAAENHCKAFESASDGMVSE